MGEFRLPSSEDERPIFKSNGLSVLFASGSSTQVSMLEPNVLIEKFGAELVLDNIRLNPYWQIGECDGAIYKLAHFPIDGTDSDYEGLYVFNTVPSEEYKKACEDPNIETVGSVCDIIVGMPMVDRFGRDDKGWFFEIPNNTDESVKKANTALQEVIDKSK